MKASDVQNTGSNYFSRGLVLLSALGILAFAGCADTYNGAYYGPDYAGYYADYGYGGAPYFGYDPGYYGGFAIENVRYGPAYGTHHFFGNSGGRRGYHGPGGGRAPGAPAGSRSAPSGPSGGNVGGGGQHSRP